MKILLSVLFIAVIIFNSVLSAQDIGEFMGYYTHWDFHQNNSPDKYFEIININSAGEPVPVFIVNNNLLYRAGGNNWQMIQPFGSTAYYSLPTLQFCKGGPLDGKILLSTISQQNNGTLFSVVNPTDWQFYTFQANVDTFITSFAYTPEGNIFGNYERHRSIYKSTNQGQSFFEYIQIGQGDPNVNLPEKLGSDFPIKVSANGQYLACIGAVDNATATGDSIIYLYYSVDYGNSWQGKIIGVKSINDQIINRNYRIFFNNFPQIAYEIDNNGIIHVTTNGYGEGTLPGSNDTTEVFPLIYWNSNTEEWIAITNMEREKPTDAVGRSVTNYYPWNSLGNAKPSLSASADGKSIVIIWESFEYNSDLTPSLQFNLFTQSGFNQYYYSDLLCQIGLLDTATSTIIWLNEPIHIQASNNSRSEQNPIASPSLIVNEGGQNAILLNYVYYHDPIPGSFILGQNTRSDDGGWFFNSYNFTPSSIDETEMFISDYNLSQNYPNPFNPSTKISWQSPVGSHQTIKVFDVLGREVATLVDEFRDAGSYEIEFDAAGLSSGIYYYQLKSVDFVETKKMILLR